ncbi:MAG TPA: hypothetical protein PL009_07905 [Flavipsychrobacter sp.]|nr:hypothetical protein [Flavipsychrobacter sp.]
MTVVFIIATVILCVLLYKMLGQGEKTYAYTRTMTISYRADGSEQISRMDESGIVFVAPKTITIDGSAYVYKSSDRKKIQARLNYEGGHLKSINLALPNGGEKFYYVDKINSVKDVMRH